MKTIQITVICVSLLCALSNAAFSVTSEHAAKYNGQVIGSGECAAGVQTVFYYYYGSWPLGLTSRWRRGAKVLGNNNIAPGTAIASFNPSGLYDCSYGCHAAIYVSQSSAGIGVYDQWQGKAWGFRTLRITASNPQSNQADRFYVIEH